MVGDGSLVTGVWSQGTLETVKKTFHIILVYIHVYLQCIYSIHQCMASLNWPFCLW